MSHPPRVLVLSDEPGWHGRVLTEAFTARRMEVAVASVTCLMAGVGGVPAFPGRAAPPDAIFVRGVPGGTAEQVCMRMEFLHRLAAVGVAVVNPPRAVEITVNKGMTSMLLDAAGIPIPATFCGESLEAARHFAERLFAAGREVVFKPLFGSQGEGLVRLGSDRELCQLVNPGGIYYLQEFVAPTAASYRDWRLFCVKSEVIAAMERRSDHWITNRAQGGVCHPLTVTPELRELAARATVAVGADYLGVDVLPGPDGPLMTEVNSIPAWQGLQRVTETDIAARLADLVLAHPAMPRSARAVRLEAQVGLVETP